MVKLLYGINKNIGPLEIALARFYRVLEKGSVSCWRGKRLKLLMSGQFSPAHGTFVDHDLGAYD